MDRFLPIAVASSDSDTTIIHPPPDTNGKVVKLSAIDQIAPRDYISSYLFFSLPSDADKKKIFHDFERALVKTISDIPELACCVRKRSGHDREEVELIFDSSQGAQIHYKDYTSPELCDTWGFGTFERLEREHFPIKSIPRHVVFGTSAKLIENAKLSVLDIQCNFISGGLIVGSCLHHVAGDGICNFILHKTLGTHVAAITHGLDVQTHPITTLERSTMIESDQGVNLAQFPDWKLTEDPTSFLNPTAYEPEEHGTAEHAIFSISTEKLALLQEHVSNGASEIELSTTEALCAFLWRHVVSARNIDHRGYCEAKLSITVDARKRVESPSIPSNFWGNFSEPNAVARVPLSNLRHPHASGGRQSMIYLELAYRIKRAIAGVNNTAVRRLIGLLNQMPKSTTLTWNVNRFPGPDMLIVCLQAHKYNDIYFGHKLGFPSAMRVTVGDTEGQPDGRCIILPPRRGVHGLEVILQYDVSTLERLENDIEFSGFFVRQN